MNHQSTKTTGGTSVTLGDIQRAAGVIEGHVLDTDFDHSRTLSALTGASIWLKFENLQFTASFKERGALNKLTSLTDAQRKALLPGDEPKACFCIPADDDVVAVYAYCNLHGLWHA